MAEEYEEVQELTDEEIFEQHRAEIDERFEEKGFFRRVMDMFKGLKQPRTSREYKLARIELQRLAAPLVAILLPVVGVIVLIVVTAVSGQVEEHVTVDIAQIQQEETQLEDTPDPPEEEIDMTQDIDVTVDVSTEVPTPDMASPAPPSPDPGGEPDKVAAAPSPVTMNAVSGTVKMRGLGDGTSGGFGTLIGNGGKAQNTAGCLIGVLIDFKRDVSGNEQKIGNGEYIDKVTALAKSNFSANELAKLYVLPGRVALSHLAIEIVNSQMGPAAFGAGKKMKPAYWGVYYTGTIKATEAAKYRLVGFFDEHLIVRLDNKTVLETSWGHGAQRTPAHGKPASAEKGNFTGWAPSDPSLVGKWISSQPNSSLVYGDWFTTKPGQSIKVDLFIGEGWVQQKHAKTEIGEFDWFGGCGGLLLIEQEGKEYEKDAKGRPILPIFATRPLAMKEKERLSKFITKGDWYVSDAKGKVYPISTSSPRFNVRVNKAEMEKMQKDDVSVQVDI